MKREPKKSVLGSGFIRKGGILGDIRSAIREAESESTKSSLAREIARYTFLIGTRLDATDDALRASKIASALTVLVQAQIFLQTDEREARKLFNLAKRLGK